MRTLSTFLILSIFLLGCFEAVDTELLKQQLDPYVGMVLIPAGEVELGAPVGEVSAHSFERGTLYPEQTVRVDSFYIDTHEVTIAEFQAFVEATGYSDGSWNWFDGFTPEHPIFASYEAAVAYAEWAGKRLPTDFEWEKAARGGLVGKRYPWGDDTATMDKAHFTPQAEARPGKPYTVPVGSYPPNGYGLYDMAGNVAEWVSAEEFTEGSYRGHKPTRGGSWFLTEWYTRVYTREILPPQGHYTSTGFRCVRDVVED